MKQSLYELAENYRQALDFLSDPDNEIDNQTIADTIESLDGEIDDKLLNFGKFIIDMEHQIVGIKEAENRLKHRRQFLENKTVRLREYCIAIMQYIGHAKLKDNEIVLSLAKLPASVNVHNEDLIPEEFWRVKTIREIDKTAIKQVGGCAGTTVESNGFRLSIK